MIFTQEQLTKAKEAKSVEELLALAKAEDVAITGEEAAKYFAELHKEGELSDDELGNVSGGCGGDVLKYHVTYGSWGYECRFFVKEPNARSNYHCCAYCAHFTVNEPTDPFGEGRCSPTTNYQPE